MPSWATDASLPTSDLTVRPTWRRPRSSCSGVPCRRVRRLPGRSAAAWPSSTRGAPRARIASGRRRVRPLGSHGRPVDGSTIEPLALTTASAPTTTSIGGVAVGAGNRGRTVLAVPTPPWSPPALAPGAGADGSPDAAGRHGHDAIARSPKSASGRFANTPPRPRSKMTAAGTTGTTRAVARRRRDRREIRARAPRARSSPRRRRRARRRSHR